MAYILKLRKTPEAMIHHSVGRRSKPSADVPTAGTGCVSLAPRRGSSSISNVGTSTSAGAAATTIDRKSTRLNSSHSQISYAVFCLKKHKYLVHALLSRDVSFPSSYIPA